MNKNDPQNQITDRAMRRVIRLLCIAFLLAALGFLTQNVFFVEEGTVAIVTRFGKIVGEDQAVIPPGGPHFAWPEPIQKTLTFPTTMQNISLDKAFASDEQEALMFVPGEDGSLLTGDKNLVQGQWSLDYLIDPAHLRDFAVNVGSLQQARTLIESVLSQAIIHAVSCMTVDDFIKGTIDNEAIKDRTQAALNRLQTGILVRHVTSKSYSVPYILKDIFLAVNRSESEKALQIEQAKRYREARLNGVFGRNWPQALQAVERYEQEGDDTILKQIFDRSQVSGQVARILDEAIIYRTATVQQVKAEAQRFQKLLAEKRKNPEILHNRLLQDTVQEIFSGSVRKYYLPHSKDKTLYLELAP